MLTQGRLPPRLGRMAVVRGDPGQLPVGSPQTPSAAVRCAPVSPPGRGTELTSEQRTDAESGLGPWLQQDTGDGNTGRVQALAVRAARSTPSPEMVPCGGQGRGVWSPPPTWDAGLSLAAPARGTEEPLSKNGSGVHGVGDGGERRREAGGHSPRSRVGPALQP